MISGLNQEVEILGRTFHFQTELSDQDGLSIRTDVFIGGKVVATRESRLTDDAAAQIDPGALRARMKEHHNKTLDSFVRRARRYQQREEAPPSGPLPAAPPEDAVAAPEPPPAERPKGLAPPSSELREAASGALRVRRFFGRFRQLMGPASALPDDFDDRLVVMSRAFAWMIRSSPFVEIRIDEQMRCHLLKEQIEEWLASERDPRQAAQIWSGIVTFNKYLSEINHRSDLQAYDQQMLIWALDEVQRHGMTGEVLKGLETLYGLDPRLDQSLDHPKDVTRGAWTALLRHVLTEV
ncbi:MAG TPA: hypothetical protein VGG06_01315 [Thermoanaerobaculia bacterium]|jgi:hypothetical protein